MAFRINSTIQVPFSFVLARVPASWTEAGKLVCVWLPGLGHRITELWVAGRKPQPLLRLGSYLPHSFNKNALSSCVNRMWAGMAAVVFTDLSVAPITVAGT